MSERDIYARKKKNETVEGRTTNVTTAADVARWAEAEKSPPVSSPKPSKKGRTQGEVVEGEEKDNPL